MAKIKSLGYTIEFVNKTGEVLNSFIKKENYSSCFILCDENTLRHCVALLISQCKALQNAHIIEIESGEGSKSIDFCNHIWQTLAENNADRNSLIINVGGGVVSDLGGFCASVYMRGIDFINVPTSLLAMADASVGGKTGIDFGGAKNLIGTFSQPKAVFVNPDFLHTLPTRHFYNGLAEIYKIALASSKDLWTEVKKDNQYKKINSIIYKSVQLKNSIVLKDPYDKLQRKVLNFGHTIGHALEAVFFDNANTLLHGEAIMCGMLIESHLAWQKKLLTKSQLDEVTTTLSNVIQNKIKVPQLETLAPALKNDKKNQSQKLRFALPNSIGSSVFDITASDKQLTMAINFYNSMF